ncbi:hypothetical protein F8O53_05885, partial [Enterobacter sp. 63]
MGKKPAVFSTRGYLLLLAVLIVTPLYLAARLDIFDPLNEKASHESEVRKQPSIKGESDLRLLSHRLISYDELQGFVTEEMASLARGNTLHFLKTVDMQCDKRTVGNFITCANNILGKQFYYKSSDVVAEAWGNRYSDCDLNSYLLMDAMYLSGFKAEIVYAPGHAFISFKDASGNLHFQETTANNNTGENADLTSPFYIKTLPGFYYQPHDSAYAEKMYPVLTAVKLPASVGQKIASEMYDVW